MRPWLHATKQGLWPRQLPLAENTICIGWLLYSAPKYDLSELQRQLKQETAVEVALHFQIINDGLPAKTTCSTPHIKAIHMEIEQSISYPKRQSIEQIYSSNAQRFPLGIKMCLMPELQAVTNPEAWNKVVQLQALQEWFLKYTETSWICSDANELTPDKSRLYDILCSMMLPTLQANNRDPPLLYTISPMKEKDGYLV